jgi:hypothetical protein
MRAAIVTLALGVASASSCRACGTSPAAPSRPAPTAAPAPGTAPAPDEGNFQIPANVREPGLPSISGLEYDVPVAWLFLTEDPAPTGAAPDVIVGAELPCGYRPVYGTVSPPVNPLRVRLRARFAGPGRPDPAAVPCPTRNVAVQYISLQRLRLGTFTVSDATPHPASEPTVPSVTLRVVEDDPRLPSRQARRLRRCTPGDDATCTAGGACGGIPGHAGLGVCVPPFDPYLVIGRLCPGPAAGAPMGSTEVALEHPGPYAARATPPAGALHACLPACDAAHPCDVGMQCLAVGERSVCAPR